MQWLYKVSNTVPIYSWGISLESTFEEQTSTRMSQALFPKTLYQKGRKPGLQMGVLTSKCMFLCSSPKPSTNTYGDQCSNIYPDHIFKWYFLRCLPVKKNTNSTWHVNVKKTCLQGSSHLQQVFRQTGILAFTPKLERKSPAPQLAQFGASPATAPGPRWPLLWPWISQTHKC